MTVAANSLPRLVHVEGAVQPPSLASLKPADEVAPAVLMTPERLRELAEARVLPHFRVDGGPPLFWPNSLKHYVRRYLTTECPGAPLPLDLRPVVLEQVKGEVPSALAMVRERLCAYPSLDHPPCVYFLLQDNQVVYVGTSRNLAGRLVSHRQEGKRWDRVLYLPAPRDQLHEIEAEWVKALKPRCNKESHSTPDERGGKEN